MYYCLSNARFPAQSPEMSMRRLADYSFMLRDYRFAYSIYDLVRKDFKTNEKANKFLAGTLVICQFEP